VKWDIFINRRTEKKGLQDDPIGDVVEIIEKFAPKGYRSERDMFFYNYKIMQPYPRPLFSRRCHRGIAIIPTRPPSNERYLLNLRIFMTRETDCLRPRQ